MTHALVNGNFLVLTRMDGSVMAVRPETVLWAEGGGTKPDDPPSRVFLVDQTDDTAEIAVDCMNLFGEVLDALKELEAMRECDE